MSKMIGFMIFALGAAIGSAAAYKFAKEKYERIAQEEIDSVKEVFSKRETPQTDSSTEPENVEPAKSATAPYVISPEEFGELDDYEKISLTYYDDQVLTDDSDELIDDVEGIIGFESLNSFGKYEDDSVFVRNDRLKCDYEILRDQRRYSDIRRKM